MLLFYASNDTRRINTFYLGARTTGTSNKTKAEKKILNNTQVSRREAAPNPIT